MPNNEYFSVKSTSFHLKVYQIAYISVYGVILILCISCMTMMMVGLYYFHVVYNYVKLPYSDCIVGF